MAKLIIDAISDTHNKHKHVILKGGDILIHAGDVSGRGQSGEIIPFLNWFAEQDYSHLILVPGNHDFGFEKEYARYEKECKDRNIILLNDSGIEIEGVKIWGSPITPWFHNWAFNRELHEIQEHWDMIPLDTEILITHGPAAGILDFIPNQNRGVGCNLLLNKILESQVKLHICGHIHEGRGFTYKHGKTWVNAACLDGHYMPMKDNPKTITKNEDGEYEVS